MEKQNSETVTLTFDLNGGKTVDGEEGSIVMEVLVGICFRLPEAPVKAGFSFAGWETMVEDKKVTLQPDEEFIVTAAQSFKALWTEG